MRKVASAFDDLAQYKSLTSTDAVKKWKQSVKDYEKASGDKLEIVEDEPPEVIYNVTKLLHWSSRVFR